MNKMAQVEEFRRRALRSHNRYRAWHGAGPLRINETLNRLAQAVAENLKYIDHLVHSDTKLPNGEPLGENLASSTGPLSGRYCTDLWYEEERLHNYAGEYMKPTGHFTQLVWKSTTQVGFGVATRGNYTVGVALYYQAGNVIGSFKQNVQPRIRPIKRKPVPTVARPQFGAFPQNALSNGLFNSNSFCFGSMAPGSNIFAGGGGVGGGFMNPFMAFPF